MKIRSWFVSLFSRNGREEPSPIREPQVGALTKQERIEATKRSLGHDSQLLRINAKSLTRRCAKLNKDLGEMDFPEQVDETS